MTMQTDPSPKRVSTFSFMRILPFLLIAIGALWYFGVFRSNPTIVLVTSSETPYWDLVIAGAKEAARQYDVKLTVIKSKPDADAQTATIRGLLSTHFDGIAVSPVNPTAQAALLSDVAAVTTLVTFDSDSPVSRRLCFVGADNYAAGRLCGQSVRQALPDGGEVILSIGNLEKENAQRRRQGVIDELLDRPFEPLHPMDPADAKLEGKPYTVVGTLVDGADAAVATEQAVQAIKDHPNVKCIVGLNAYSAPALLAALEKTQNLGKIHLVGFDAAEETLAGIENGNIDASILQDQFGCGFHTVRILAENARGDRSGLPMFQRRTLPVEVVNKANIAALRGQLSPTTKPS